MTTATEKPTWSDLVLQWAIDRNFFEGSNPRAQLGKLIEEVSELQIALASNNETKVIDAIGDCSVVLRIMAAQLEIKWEQLPPDSMRIKREPIAYVLQAVANLASNLYEERDCTSAIAVCLDSLSVVAMRNEVDVRIARAVAWNTIKDRKGKMIDCVFVKEE